MDPRLPETDLVIFDCDGVLVDSEELSCRCLAEAMTRVGIDMSTERAMTLFLGRSSAALTDYCQAAGTPLPATFLPELAREVRKTFRAQLQPIAGVAAVLEQLRVPHCVASSSDIERVKFSLELTGLAAHFGPHLYTSQMVRHGKPAPDLFLHAAAAMGAEPHHALVIEDSVSGVTAAKAAGMKVWGFVGGAHYRSADGNALLRQAGADRIFAAMTDFWTEG
ncbi:MULTISPECIES: HAD family hydrolase [Bradyrhizobium]|jgi:HAD superfamily hydrolase (TIGR01509 family)|uniref:HAD family hydrolase n=1 Tax=Bradyrhizobium TaxID=374 RepID=UPI0004165A2B|nr:MULTISPECIES: HAD family hydrolase [Bradyrhizobium]KIU49547.1 hydrolase [Bradyrhizobium elkanii]MBK5656568.1 HAD family hydrolase [Rhizobium sp.]OCX31879.1 hydrolase [Bradyrhizobium sp. UASWS1016]